MLAPAIYRPIERLETEQSIRFLRFADGSSPYIRASVPAPTKRNPEFKLDRFYWRCIVRGEEDRGVQWFAMSKGLHHIVIGGILANPVLPVLSRKQKFFRWCANLWLVSRVGLRQRLMNLVPQPTDCLDPVLGFDFVVRMGFKGQTEENRRGFPTYEDSRFKHQSVPAGTAAQIALWQQQMLKMEPPKIDQLI